MNHIFFGALGPFVVLAVLYLLRQRRASLRGLVFAPVLMLCGSIWAILPDLPRYAGLHTLYLQLMSDPRTNIFFFHHYIDLVETDSPYYNIGVIAMVCALFAVAWWELRRGEMTGA